MLETQRKITATLVGLIVMAAPFAASSAASLPPAPVADENVADCVEEVGRHAEYPDRGTVRHDVEVEQRQPFGHRLRILTMILHHETGEELRRYKSVCNVVRGHEPLKFRIREIASDIAD